MHKLSQEKIDHIIKVLDKANNAINILERANNNRIVFLETKTEVQKLQEELSSRFSNKLTSLNE